jgi:hypothetical protein
MVVFDQKIVEASGVINDGLIDSPQDVLSNEHVYMVRVRAK